ncbi:hypothetical protein [Spirulina major]|nr:hypothetical protein [Spirulina major]
MAPIRQRMREKRRDRIPCAAIPWSGEAWCDRLRYENSAGV